MGSCSTFSSAGLNALLEGILEQLTNFNSGAGVLLTPIPAASVAAGDLETGSYSQVLTDEHNKKFILIQNDTDGAVWISLNGSDDHFKVGPGSLKLDLGSDGALWNSHVHVRADVDSTPGTGNVVISAYY